MSKLIISGKKAYTHRMFKHLKKEHPSTRHRMILKDKNESTFKPFIDKRKTHKHKGVDGVHPISQRHNDTNAGLFHEEEIRNYFRKKMGYNYE